MPESRRRDLIEQDVHDLARLGYAQQLFREMGGFSNFAISFSIISILTGAVAIAWVVLICIVFSLPPNELVLWTMLLLAVILAAYWRWSARWRFGGPAGTSH